MRVCLSEITWAAVAAIATFIAVVVALIPIWRDAHRRTAHARGLRIRLCSKLMIFRPSLIKAVRGNQPKLPAAILSKDEFREAVRSVSAMMQESSVLQPKEQDHLGIALMNLEAASKLYGSIDGFSPEMAKDTLKLMDTAISVMEEKGLLSSPIKLPWEDEEQPNPQKGTPPHPPSFGS